MPEEKESESKEFLERKKLIELQTAADDRKFKQKMDCIIADMENNRLFHERELERSRIKTAEQRKLMQEKDYLYKTR